MPDTKNIEKQKKILFASHKKAQCGVYEFGQNILSVLKDSKKYDFIDCQCQTLEELKNEIATSQPNAIIYNYHPSTMPWAVKKILPRVYRNNLSTFKPIQIGIIHEITQRTADTATAGRKKYFLGKNPANSLFDAYIAPDPTLLLLNPLVYKTGRLIKRKKNINNDQSQTIVGSFGFATPNKGFEKIIELVQKEFDQATVRLNIPNAKFGDQDGSNAKTTAANCQRLITKSGIKLEITHDFLDEDSLINFLEKNTANVFLYEDNDNRGLSSAIDLALSARKPIAISRCSMFRHISDVKPSICVEDNNLKSIIANGFFPLQNKYEEWSPENLLWDYERILDKIFKEDQNQKKKIWIKRIVSRVYRLITGKSSNFSWLRDSTQIIEDERLVVPSLEYCSILKTKKPELNLILNDAMRELYAPAIMALQKIAPKTFAQKIPRANVQQAFVFDTVNYFLPQYHEPKILCVGSYEDTAAISLTRLGEKIEEIDPVINYSLQEYFSKPTTIKNSYNIIFATSVIEHDPNDEIFLKCLVDLLAPSGVAILTCDYQENWQVGEGKPGCNARLYNKSDLTERFKKIINGCNLLGEQKLDCPNPDFEFDHYKYSFATFVFKKNNI